MKEQLTISTKARVVEPARSNKEQEARKQQETARQRRIDSNNNHNKCPCPGGLLRTHDRDLCQPLSSFFFRFVFFASNHHHQPALVGSFFRFFPPLLGLH